MIGLEHGRKVIGLSDKVIDGLLLDHELKGRKKILFVMSTMRINLSLAK